MTTRVVAKHWALLTVLLVSSLCAGCGWRNGVAPNGNFASRRAWGERAFGSYLEHIDTWVTQSELLRHDVGHIQGIAPIGSPNRYYPGFTDGQHARMNLEVIGSNGKGELYLPYVEIRSTGELRSVGDEARWKFGGEEHLIAKSGKSYLAEYGLQGIYQQLLRLGESNSPQEFLDRWDDFGVALATTSLRSGGSRTGQPRLLSVLHDLYRKPLLIHLGQALADLGRNDEGAEAYRQAADLNLWRADQLLQEAGQRDLEGVAEELRRANELLRLANDLVPNDRSTLRLAGERVVLQYLHSIGGRPEPVYTENGKHDQRWAEACLGLFYCEAETFARSSPYLEESLGGIRTVRIAQHATSELRVDSHQVYEAPIFLEVVGKTGRGQLLVTLRENPRRCTPIDLFSDLPRSPDYPLKLSYPSWTPDGGEWVKLSAKTGELRRKTKD